MSLVKDVSCAIRSTLALWVLTAIIYPAIVLGVGQVVFPFQANGSLVENSQGNIIGSALIGQPFTSDRYFSSRPSAIDYSTMKENLATGVSGASNLAPSNPDLLKRVQEQVTSLKQAGITPTADLVYASGSGLDPHISVDAARNQISRVAKARGLNTNQVELLMTRFTEGRFLGIFGEPGVNVLKLNLELDKARSK
ncbi:MAG: K(+)-transporting ATPase subunit C [Xenococcaceae cyanobacterium]